MSKRKKSLQQPKR